MIKLHVPETFSFSPLSPLNNLFSKVSSFSPIIIGAFAGLILYKIYPRFNSIDLHKTPQIDPCSHLWFERLPNLKSRVEALKIFSFANSMDYSLLSLQWKEIENLLGDPENNREKIVRLAKSLQADLETVTKLQLQNPLPKR